MAPDAALRKQVKEALEHLYDTAYLSAHPLAARLAPPSEGGQLGRAQQLRGVLKQAIETLRPQADLPRRAPEWRSYLALRYRYAQGMSLGQVEHELGISLRQLQRELRKGLDALVVVLDETRWPGGVATQAEPAAPGSPRALAVEVDELRLEMRTWRFTREACDVRAMLGDTLATLEPQLGAPANVVVDLPAGLAPVWVDATLMRQALVYVLRLALQAAQGHSLHLGATAEGQQTLLWLSGPAWTVAEGASDWQMGALLLEQQGGRLAVETVAGGATAITVTLPRAAAPRVLVIDDNQAIHQLFERYLAAHAYEVLHVYGGPDAQRQAAGEQPDVILLDVMMPHVDGWQVLRTLKSDSATATIPVIVCSVLNEPALAVSLGATAYLKKPVERLELLAALAGLRLVARRGAADPPAAP